MQVKKVITNDFYQKEYVMVNGKIYEKDYLDQFKNLIISDKEDVEAVSAMLKNYDNKLHPASNLEEIFYTAFPSNEKMIEIINQKRDRIYKTLNLKKIKCENAQAVRAMLLFDYLVKNTNYDMMVVEDIFLDHDSIAKLDWWQKENDKKTALINEAQTACEKSINKEDFTKNLKIFKQRVDDQTAFIAQLEDDTIYEKNRQHLKAIYSVLVNKKGVCSEYSYAYQFLLQGIGIENYYVEAMNQQIKVGHAFNVVKTGGKNTPKYFIADVTKGKGYFKHSPKFSFLAFAMPMQEFFEENKDKEVTSIQISAPISTMFKKEYREELFEEELLKEIRQNELSQKTLKGATEYAKRFIKNKYQEPEQEENIL
jgi:hypothetical protein